MAIRYGHVLNNVAAFKSGSLGQILVSLITPGRPSATNIKYCNPVDARSCRIPMTNEIVSLTQAPRGDYTQQFPNTDWYYDNTLSANFQINANVHRYVQTPNVDTAGADISGGSPKVSSEGEFPFSTTFEFDNISALQPFEGDVILGGRSGNFIRLGSTADDNKIYDAKRTWSGKSPNDPIMILSNSTRFKGDELLIEDIEEDDSILIMATSQKLNFAPSQTNIGLKQTPVNTYDSPQVVISSDRIFFNAKSDSIILSAKKDVTVCTPAWAMEMDTMFTLLEQLTSEIVDLYAGTTQLLTPVGGPTLGSPGKVAKVVSILSQIKAMKQ